MKFTSHKDQKKIDRKDLQLKREEESHIGGRYFRNFGNEKPPRRQNQDQADRNNEIAGDTESTTFSNQDETVATHEPGVYPAIPIQDYRHCPIEDIAVHYVRINRVVEKKATRSKQQEDNVRAAELDFMIDLETLSKEITTDLILIDLNCCIGDNNFNQIPNEYKSVARTLTHRWGITLVNDRMFVPKTLRYAALNALHLGHPGHKEICKVATFYWWPNMWADI